MIWWGSKSVRILRVNTVCLFWNGTVLVWHYFFFITNDCMKLTLWSFPWVVVTIMHGFRYRKFKDNAEVICTEIKQEIIVVTRLLKRRKKRTTSRLFADTKTNCPFNYDSFRCRVANIPKTILKVPFGTTKMAACANKIYVHAFCNQKYGKVNCNDITSDQWWVL